MPLSIEPNGLVAIHQVRDSIVPIYQQIRNRIVGAIAAGELPAGSGLPATWQLAVHLGVNFHTVNKAYGLLRREGLLRIGRKAGAVVQRDTAGGPPRPGWERDWAGRLRTLLAEAAAQGLPADGIILHCHQDAVARFAFPAGPTGPPARREPGHDVGEARSDAPFPRCLGERPTASAVPSSSLQQRGPIPTAQQIINR